MNRVAPTLGACAPKALRRFPERCAPNAARAKVLERKRRVQELAGKHALNCGGYGYVAMEHITESCSDGVCALRRCR